MRGARDHTPWIACATIVREYFAFCHIVLEACRLTGVMVDWRTAQGTLKLVTPLEKHTIQPGVRRQSMLDAAREMLSTISPQ